MWQHAADGSSECLSSGFPLAQYSIPPAVNAGVRNAGRRALPFPARSLMSEPPRLKSSDPEPTVPADTVLELATTALLDRSYSIVILT
jgi:hypothetical protein